MIICFPGPVRRICVFRSMDRLAESEVNPMLHYTDMLILGC